MATLVEVQHSGDDVVVLTLNRPKRRNALTIALMERLCGQIAELEAADNCRVIVLQGAGPAFCGGLDLAEARETEVAEQSAHWVARTLQAISGSSLISIAAAHGAAMAGGAGLMAACDLVVAASDLRVGFPEVRRGLVPALVSTVLCDRCSTAALRELFLLAEPIDAKQARRLGLVNRIVEPSQVLSTALEMADTVLLGAPQAVQDTKQLLTQLRGLPPDQRLEKALDAHTGARNSAEAKEGLAAFLEKREPRW